MRKNIDLIKGLILKIDQHTYSKSRDKKTVAKMSKTLRDCFNSVFSEVDEDAFRCYFEKLISSVVASPYITSNFFPANSEEYGREDIPLFSRLQIT